jgi:hypothetical protein
MNTTMKRFAAAALAVTLVASLSACSNWSKRDRNTAIGAGAGALGVPFLPMAARSVPWAAQLLAELSAIRLVNNTPRAENHLSPYKTTWMSEIYFEVMLSHQPI